MTDFDLPAIAAELNAKALNHPIGQLQEIRRKLKNLDRIPGKDIFRIGSKTVACELGVPLRRANRTAIQHR